MNQNREIRRLQGLLYTSGQGMLLYSVWSAIRIFLVNYMLKAAPETAAAVGQHDAVVYFIVLLLVVAIDLGLHFRVGFDAMAVAKGEKRGRTYLILAGFMAVAMILSWALICLAMTKTAEVSWDLEMMISGILDLVLLAISIEVIFFSVKLARLRREEA